MHSVAIIGAGFGGLGAAIRLKQAGINDFVVLERAGDVGGTWRDNTYPGCACDVESHLYSFSFASNPRWTRVFAPQQEIWDYLRECTDRFGIRRHIRFHHPVEGTEWNEREKHWRIVTSQGTFSARFLIVATGPLSEPSIPPLPGLEKFEGKVMHSARWDHDYDLRGRKTAVIGTGASAIQIVPAIQPSVARLHLFQRTPAWVLPRPDRAIRENTKKRLERFPALLRFRRWRLFWIREVAGFSFRHPWAMAVAKAIALLHLRRGVPDPELRKKLTPRYTIGCKRILLSNDYFPSLTRPNVEVVTDPIREFRAHSVVTRDGVEREIDTLILGTGFHATEPPIARLIRGRGARILSDVWNGSPRGFLGTTVVDFPNLFLLLGPNTGIGHTSILLMMEAQVEHLLNAILFVKNQKAATIEARPEAEARFNRRIDRKLQGTVWTSGNCSSWYIDKAGRASAIWPSSIPSFRKRLARFDPNEYLITPKPRDL